MYEQRSFDSDCHQALCKYADISSITQIKASQGNILIGYTKPFLINLIFCTKFNRKHSSFHCNDCKYWFENTEDKQSITNWFEKQKDAYYHPNIFEKIFENF